MQIQQNIPLAPLTTLGVGGTAQYFVTVSSGDKAVAAFQLAQQKGLPLLVMAGGSNLVVADRGLEAVVLRPDMRGIQVVHEDETTLTLRAGAGEVWDDVVAYAVAQGWWGIENLSAIPGFVGAAPIQNIGAYGQEVQDTITRVEALDMHDGHLDIFSHADCDFSYRHSRFNGVDKGRYLVLSVDFTLHKDGQPHLDYKDLKAHFDGQPTPTVAQMREAVVAIRTQKLHNPADMGNAGSFFKNKEPFISEAMFDAVVARLTPTLSVKQEAQLLSFKTNFRTAEGIKIPGGFLVEICGLMGAQVGGMAVSDKHALVLVNKTGTATADDALKLAAHVIKTVYQKTRLSLVVEPMFVGFTQDELTLLIP